MQESVSAQVHRSGRKSKAYSRHDHKCHKAKHKSTESLLEKADRTKNYLSHKKDGRGALSVDSGLAQPETLSPFQLTLGLAYRHMQTQNAKLQADLEKTLRENADMRQTQSLIREENENLKTDISLMKNLVYKLNVELEKFQKGGRGVEGGGGGAEKLPKYYEKNFLKPVVPLLKAYSEALQEKDEMIRDLEVEYTKFSSAFNDLMRENEKLYMELEKKLMKAEGGVPNEVKVLKRDLEMAQRENDLLFQQIKLEKEKLFKVHSIFKAKVEEVSAGKEQLANSWEECKSELFLLKGKYAVLKQEFERVRMENDTRVPLAVYSASVSECQRLFQELKVEYENEKQRLALKIKEQETILTRQNKREEERAEEKSLLETNNFKQCSEIDKLRKKVAALEKQVEVKPASERDRLELLESKRQLRESNRRVEELSSKLSTTRTQLQKTMAFAEEIVRGQEELLLQLHAKQKESHYMTTHFGSLRNQLKNVERGAQEGLNTIEAKIRSLEAENRALAEDKTKLEKTLAEKEDIIRKLEPTKDF